MKKTEKAWVALVILMGILIALVMAMVVVGWENKRWHARDAEQKMRAHIEWMEEEQDEIDCATVRAMVLPMVLPKDAKIEGFFGVGIIGENRFQWFVTYSLASQKALPYEAIGFEGRVQITDSVVHCFEEVEP